MTQQLLKAAPVRIGKRRGLRTETLAEARQQDGVETVRLGLNAERTGEAANAPGVDDGDGQAGVFENAPGKRFQSAGGFENNQPGSGGAKLPGERTERFGLTRHAAAEGFFSC